MTTPKSFDIGDFVKTKFDSLDGKTKVSFAEKESDFQIVVSRSGMSISGKLAGEVTSEKELQAFAKLISDAWALHRTLKPRIVSTIAGH